METRKVVEQTKLPNNETKWVKRGGGPAQKKSSSRSAFEWALHATDGLARGKCFPGSKLA